MQLIMSPPSPFVRKVRAMIIETGQQDAVEDVNVSTTPLVSDPVAVSANPLGKIPALVRDDGPAIYDSRVITRFLNERVNGPLYPHTRIWEVLTLEATGDAIMDAAVGMVYEARFKGSEGASGDWIEAQWAKITRALAAINTRWMSHLNGPLDMSHIAVGCALGYLDFRHPERDWRDANDTLATWYATFSQRDSMKLTAPE